MPLVKVRKGFTLHRTNYTPKMEKGQKILIPSVSVHGEGSTVELDPKELPIYAHQVEIMPIKKEVSK